MRAALRLAVPRGCGRVGGADESHFRSPDDNFGCRRRGSPRGCPHHTTWRGQPQGLPLRVQASHIMKRLLPPFIALAVLAALVFWVSQSGGLPEPWGTRIGQNLSRGGHFGFLLLSGLFLLFGPLRPKENRAFRIAWIAGAVALDFAVVQTLKHIAFWPRPVDVGQTAQTASRGSGFPSGHTVPAFLVAALVGYIEPRLQIPALVMAVLIGYSRVEVTAHFALQVWISALIGLALGELWTRVHSRREREA